MRTWWSLLAAIGVSTGLCGTPGSLAAVYVDPSQEFVVSAIPTQYQYSPRIWGNTVLWTDGLGGDVYAKDTVSGEVIPVSVGQGGSGGHGANIHENSIVWSASPGTVWVFDLSTRSRTEVTGNGSFPDVHSELVAWETGHVISVKNILTRAVTTIPGTGPTASRADRPGIWGDNVIWTGDSLISGYNLSSHVGFEVSAPGHADWPPPDIQGSIVVWRDTRNDNLDIYGADISDLDNIVEFPVCTEANEQSSPKVFGSFVVWTDYRNGDQDIYGFDLVTQTEFPVAVGPGNQFSPAIYQNTVIWSNELDGNINIKGNTIVPEPATLFILTLGGLAVLRRRERCADHNRERVRAAEPAD